MGKEAAATLYQLGRYAVRGLDSDLGRPQRVPRIQSSQDQERRIGRSGGGRAVLRLVGAGVDGRDAMKGREVCIGVEFGGGGSGIAVQVVLKLAILFCLRVPLAL